MSSCYFSDGRVSRRSCKHCDDAYVSQNAVCYFIVGVGFVGLTDAEMVKSFKKETYQLQQTETVIFH